MSGPKAETIQLMILAKKLRREGLGRPSIYRELKKEEAAMNNARPERSYARIEDEDAEDMILKDWEMAQQPPASD
jgi:hypothetical protein